MNEKRISISLLAAVMAMSVQAAEPVEGGNMPKAADVGGGGTNRVATASTYVMPKETREQKDARMKWFREARYGLFIHWGPSAILGAGSRGERSGDQHRSGETNRLQQRGDRKRRRARPCRDQGEDGYGVEIHWRAGKTIWTANHPAAGNHGAGVATRVHVQD